MYLAKQPTILLYLSLVLIFGGVILVPHSLFAGTYRVVLDECKKRTGLGDSMCKSLVKNNLTIESCKERAGLSEADCAKRIEEIKKDPEFTNTKTVSPVPSIEAPTSPARSLNLPRTSVQNNDVIGKIRSKKEGELSELGKRTELIVASLKGQGIDTKAIESNFPELEKRAADLLSAYDTYRAAYLGTRKDSSSVQASVRGDARNVVLVARNAFIDYYRLNILAPLRLARDQVK